MKNHIILYFRISDEENQVSLRQIMIKDSYSPLEDWSLGHAFSSKSPTDQRSWRGGVELKKCNLPASLEPWLYILSLFLVFFPHYVWSPRQVELKKRNLPVLVSHLSFFFLLPSLFWFLTFHLLERKMDKSKTTLELREQDSFLFAILYIMC